MPVNRTTVVGLQGLLEHVLHISESLPGGANLWFRGLRTTRFNLLPKIMRDGMSPEDVFERERRLLTRFRQRSIAYWSSGLPQSDWENLFAMQHYGMPTRLLDWSENLFVAAYFALNSVERDSRDLADTKPVVWCVDPGAWNRSTSLLSEYGDGIQVLTTADEELEAYRPETTKRRTKSPIAMYGAHNSARIVAQRGTFMVWGNEARSLEEFAAEQAATLWALEIDGDRDGLARSLRTIGFGETMVFPELQYLASELSQVEGWRQ